MKVSPAENKSILSKRLKRFFDSESKRRGELCRFIDRISKEVDVYVFGGVIRDIALYGVRQFDSDIDLVYMGDDSNLQRLLRHYNADSNKYGGKRLKVGCWMVDIWAADESWAFRKKYLKFESVESLLDTTITNWDAILYRWKDKQIICKENYFADISERYLDIVFELNENEFNMCARILRWIDAKPVARKLSPKVKSILATAYNKYPKEKLLDKATQPFPQRQLQLESEYLLGSIESNIGGMTEKSSSVRV